MNDEVKPKFEVGEEVYYVEMFHDCIYAPSVGDLHIDIKKGSIKYIRDRLKPINNRFVLELRTKSMQTTWSEERESFHTKEEAKKYVENILTKVLKRVKGW